MYWHKMLKKRRMKKEEGGRRKDNAERQRMAWRNTVVNQPPDAYQVLLYARTRPRPPIHCQHPQRPPNQPKATCHQPLTMFPNSMDSPLRSVAIKAQIMKSACGWLAIAVRPATLNPPAPPQGGIRLRRLPGCWFVGLWCLDCPGLSNCSWMLNCFVPSVKLPPETRAQKKRQPTRVLQTRARCTPSA